MTSNKKHNKSKNLRLRLGCTKNRVRGVKAPHMIKLIIIFGVFLSSQAFACFAPPEEQHVNDNKLIERTTNIVLAAVTSAAAGKNEYEVTYNFEILRTIKGDMDQFFTLNGHRLHEGGMRTFNNHFDDSFWQNSWGRESNETDCVIYPAFSVGGIYLIFLDAPYHSKSFEQIIRTHGDNNTKDKWLQYVEQKVKFNKNKH